MLDLNRLKGEYTILAYLATYAARTRDVLRRAAVSESTFADPNCRDAFAALMREPSDDTSLLLRIAKKKIAALADDKSADEFMGLAESDALYDKAQRDGDCMAMSVWNRSLELVLKLALLYAISESLGTQNDFAISRDAVVWAWRLVKSLQLRMLDMVAENTAANPLDEKVLRALRFIRKAGRKGVTRAALSRKTHLSAKEMDDIEATLLDRDEITVRALPNGANGRAAKLYIVVKGK